MFEFLFNEVENNLLDETSESTTVLSNFVDTGLIVAINDGIVLVRGLEGAMLGEIVLIFTNDFNSFFGQAMNLNEDGTTGVVLFGDDSGILPGAFVMLTGDLLKVKTGYEYLGTIVDALGLVQVQDFLDERSSDDLLTCILEDKHVEEVGIEKLLSDNYSLIEVKAPGIITRQTVNRGMYTGIKAIDGLIPIGRGQRELIIGDRQTGKTTIAVDAILRQNRGMWIDEKRHTDMFSIYVAIGQKRSSVLQLYRFFCDENSANTMLIVAATASEPSALQFLAPYTGVTFGEYFRDSGKDALIIYDDLSKHAVAYRQMSLLLRRPPGREAYPGDVFYLHSRLLERAAQLNSKFLGGSLTALPLIETQGGDVTAYIPTNVISITDGQIFLEAELFYKSIRPAINMGLSVSRVGSTAQLKAMRQVAGSLKLQLAQFRELEAFVSFGGELDEETQRTINRGLRLVEVLKQMPYRPYDVHAIIVVLYAGLHGFLDGLAVDMVLPFEQKLIKVVSQNVEFIELLKEEGQLTDIVEAVLIDIITDVLKTM